MAEPRMRVEDLAAAAEVSVDTIRYYQARGLLPSPERRGRIAWYGSDHLSRLARIKALAARGLTLATIGRLLRGELDPADEELAAAVEVSTGGTFDLAELARRSGIPQPLLEAVAREGFLVSQAGGFDQADVAAAAAGLQLLQEGLPLPELMGLARRHHAAMREVAEEAVRLFDSYVRQPLRESSLLPDEAASRLVSSFEVLLPATVKMVTHHFQRTLLAVALEHIERVGDGHELEAVRDAAAG